MDRPSFGSLLISAATLFADAVELLRWGSLALAVLLAWLHCAPRALGARPSRRWFVEAWRVGVLASVPIAVVAPLCGLALFLKPHVLEARALAVPLPLAGAVTGAAVVVLVAVGLRAKARGRIE